MKDLALFFQRFPPKGETPPEILESWLKAYEATLPLSPREKQWFYLYRVSGPGHQMAEPLLRSRRFCQRAVLRPRAGAGNSLFSAAQTVREACLAEKTGEKTKGVHAVSARSNFWSGRLTYRECHLIVRFHLPVRRIRTLYLKLPELRVCVFRGLLL